MELGFSCVCQCYQPVHAATVVGEQINESIYAGEAQQIMQNRTDSRMQKRRNLTQKIGYTSDGSQAEDVEATQGLARAKNHYYLQIEGHREKAV